MQSNLPDGLGILSPRQLSEVLCISEKKLAHDRISGIGIPFLKIGRLCRYRWSDVVAWQNEQVRRSTPDKGGRNV